MKTIIIAEAGVNHNGNYELAKKMVVAAKDAGADYVKFQTAIPKLVISRYAEKAEYQKNTTNPKQSQLEMCEKIHLPLSDYLPLKSFCEQIEIKFLSTPFDLVSIDLLSNLSMDFFKIPSGEITNYPYLKKIAQYKRPVILSTGMSTMDDIGNAMEILLNNGLNKNDITILHCNTEYPTPFEDVNLRAMQTIAERFAVKVGYSDHTQGIEASIAAVALGATVIEKHFTLSRDMEGPDHKASLEPDELKAMVAAIRNVEKALGNGEKQVTDSERKNMNIARKSIVAAKDIKKGAIFAEDNITVKRPGNGISPMRWEEVLGKTANRDFCEDELIELENENEEILVSIIIPVYTVEISFLETCLDSALNQTYTNLEILLIDDKSPDENVIRTLELYAQKDKRIRLIKKQQNDGVSITRQQGVNISAGGYICFLDCDDYLTLNCIELLLHKAKTTNADIIVGDYWRTYDTFKIQYPHSLNEQSSTGYLVAMLTSKCGGTIWGKLIKSDILKKIDIPVFKGRDNDSLANFYFACGNFKIVSLGQPIYNWVYRKTSVTLTRKQSSVQYGFRIVNEICKLIKDQPCFNEIQNEFAYYKLSVWSLLLSHGIKYNNDNKAFRGDIAICWKNQWAKRQLKSSQKIILFCNQKPYLRVIYILYTHIGKPILLKFFLKPYRNILK